jgi:hypothetical protein
MFAPSQALILLTIIPCQNPKKRPMNPWAIA